MNVLMVTSEAVPFAKTGGLADAVSALATHLSGHDVRVVLPRYYFIDRNGLERVDVPLGVPMGEEELWCAVYRAAARSGAQSLSKPGAGRRTGAAAPKPGDVTFYFLDREDLYGRDGVYGTGYEPAFHDNAKRFAFLGHGALQLCRMLQWTPDVVHCHDWTSALAAVLLRSSACPPELSDAAVLLTIHNMGYQGTFDAEDARVVGLSPQDFASSGLEHAGRINFLKAAIEKADIVTTVSEGYAREIRTPEFGFGLESTVDLRGDDVVGIVNGIDYGVWNPESDPLIPTRYSASDLHLKERNKEALLTEAGLPHLPETPLIGMVSRLVEQKGFRDLCGPQSRALSNICADLPVQCVILGTGEAWCEAELERLDGNLLSLRAFITFDNRLAHLIEAGSDFFLMPSRYEPCGLNQLYSLRYGTIPIVTATGGLKDTIDEYDPVSGNGTGFFVDGWGGREIYRAVERAVEVYRTRPDHIQRLRANGMAKRFGWDESARKYVAVYERAIAKRRSRRESAGPGR